MAKLAFLLILVHFIYSKIPDYTLMKRNETLTFQLSTSNSSFYVYLPYEEDYEIDEGKVTMFHFLKMDKRIGFNYYFIHKTEDFPDESEFNRSSIEYINDDPPLEVYKNIELNLYFRLEYEKDENETIIFVFYIKDKFIDSFEPNETFSICRVILNAYKDNIIINTQLEPESAKMYGFYVKKVVDCLVYVNNPISSIYELTARVRFIKNMTNINLYSYNLDRDIKEFDYVVLIVYNPNYYKQNIFIECKKESQRREYNSIYLNQINSYTIFLNDNSVTYINVGQPGLFRITVDNNYFLFLFCDNITEIKNLTDFLDIKHYKYSMEKYLYISNTSFIILLKTQIIGATAIVERVEITEMEKEINLFDFEYFKISKGNTLNFNLNKTNQNIVLKLLSNNGIININKNDYFFNENK